VLPRRDRDKRAVSKTPEEGGRQVSKNYEPTYEGQLDKCQDERHALQMQLEEYIEAFEFERKEFHEALDDIAKMKAERDEARFAAAYQYAKHHNGNVQTLMDNFCELKGWKKFEFFVGDDDHAKEGL
jgi:uncharacterized coiled-coil DUF342 family protein